MSACVKINGQEIPWSFIQKVRRACGGDWDRTIDAFWKARNAKGENGIIKYIAQGLKYDAKQNCYSLLPSAEREKGQQEFERVREWWNQEVHQPKKRPTEVKHTMRNFFLELAKGCE